MATQLSGRRIVITGASRGLGREMAIAVANAGGRPVVTGRDLDALATTVEMCDGNATPIVLDVSDPAAVEQAAAEIFADGAVDGLVNNAGISLVKPLVDTTDDEWHSIIDINLTGTFHCCRSFGRRLLEQGHGTVVNVSSDIGIRGVACWGAYGASKGAIITLSKTLAWEWAPHLTVNVIAPGAFLTDMNREALADEDILDGVTESTPLGRIGDAHEIGPLAVYLLSSDAAFMTGNVIPLDGGIRRS